MSRGLKLRWKEAKVHLKGAKRLKIDHCHGSDFQTCKGAGRLVPMLMVEMVKIMKIVYKGAALQNADKAIEKAITSWQAAQKAVQIALVAILFNLYRSNDGETAIKRLNTLLEGVKGVNTTAIVEWAVRMGFTVTEDGFQTAPSQEQIEELAGKGFELAKKLHWWDLKPVNPFAGYNFEDQINTVLDRTSTMLKRVEEGKLSDDDAEKVVIDVAQVQRVRDALTAKAA